VDMVKNSTMDDSHDLARDMLSGLRQVTRLHRHRVEQAGFRVLKSPDIPSVLVETAFISNPSEERKLRDPKVQSKLAGAIYSGMDRYFRDNPPPGTVLALRDRKHRVIKGDTLSDLADQYQVPVSYLRKVNQIHGDNLQIGDILLIPTHASDS
jgi:N-acetylmuramoyl-L-alanine amidase